MALIGNFRSQMLWDNIRKSDLSAVVNLLENGTINLEERDENGQTFLMVACQQGDVSLVRELLDAGIDPNGIDNDSWSALLYAAKDGHLEIVIELVERDADIDHRDLCNWSGLMWASYKGHATVVEELLERGADPNIKAEMNMSCLCWAAGRGHTAAVKALLQKGAKVNSTDKYGTTPLIWAARKGHLEIVQDLLNEGANVDITGMDSLTALLVATKGGYTEIVQALLEYDPNVNATDKDGFTALTIATKEGYEDIVQELLAKDAYVNIADRANDTILIHAVKGGYTNIVRAVLNRYADVDVEGCDRKTALYWAVEKGHAEITKLLLDNDADIEISTKDGDTPLMRAVRNRFELIVRLLLDKGAKVAVFDKKGDSALHISLRARSKRITELLLRNPRHSRLLYRPNKAGETPYSIDAYHQKGILTQIHGHRQLNASDGENLLGYEIYSSSLADILSEPSLNTPITTGLYAKWGSGKSFLIGKLKHEMKQFTKANEENQLSFTWSLLVFLLLTNSLLGSVLALAIRWELGVGVGLGLFVWEYGFLGLIWFCSTRYNVRFARRVNQAIGKRLARLTMLLQVLFCNPISKSSNSTDTVPLVKFLFSENTKLTSVGGEKALAAMVAALSESIEGEFGMLATRLFSCLKQASDKNFIGRFKTVCCIPIFVIVVFVLLCFVTGIALLVTFKISDNEVVNGFMIGFGVVVATTLLVNIRIIYRMLIALTISQKYRIMRAADKMHAIKIDGFMQVLKIEVGLMNSLITTMDKFTSNTTRLVVVVDGLDTCEQEKVVQVLDIIQTLFNDDNSPFVVILAVDPQIIIKGIDQNLKSSLADSMVNGFDYLRNIVHLPFYLQSQGLQVKQQKMTKSVSTFDLGHESPTHNSKAYRHQESMMSSISDAPSSKKGGSRKRTTSDNIAQVTHSNFDIHHTLTKNDYFSDVNPKSMRRLMNIVAVTGRLLRAYNIDFNWYRLAAWVNLIEQWPYRMSWCILYFEEHDDLNDDLTLRFIYDKVVPQMPVSSDVEPLLEIDRNVRKLEAFLTSKSSSSPMLNVADLKLFLPCTINLDPYLRKLIRNLQQQMLPPELPLDLQQQMLPPELPLGMFNSQVNPGAAARQMGSPDSHDLPPAARTPLRGNPRGSQPGGPMFMPQGHLMSMGQMGMHPHQGMMGMHPYMYGGMGMGGYRTPEQSVEEPASKKTGPDPRTYIKDYRGELLSKLSTEEVSSLLSRIDKLNSIQLRKYQQAVLDNNINGLVLKQCDLEPLGSCLNMKFGDWQLFQSAILALREYEDSGVGNIRESSSPERPAASSFRKNRSDTSRKSIHFSDSDSSHPNMSAGRDMDRVESGPAYTFQSSSETTGSRADSMAGFDAIPEVEEQSSSQESQPQPKLKRQDSIVAEMIYESALVNEFMHNFTEISEGEDNASIESDEDMVDPRIEEYKPTSRDRVLPVQFTLNSYDGDTSSILSDDNNDHDTIPSGRFDYQPEREPLILETSQKSDTSVPILNLPKLAQIPKTEKPTLGKSNTRSQPYIPQTSSQKQNQYELKPLLEQGKAISTTSAGFQKSPAEVFETSDESLSSMAVVDETRGASASPSLSLRQSIEQFTMQEAGTKKDKRGNQSGSSSSFSPGPGSRGTSPESDTSLITGKDVPKKGKTPQEFV